MTIKKILENWWLTITKKTKVQRLEKMMEKND